MGIAVYGSCGVWGLRCLGAMEFGRHSVRITVYGSCDVKGLRCVGVAVLGVVVCDKLASNFDTLQYSASTFAKLQLE